jgi:hypothetical protein
VLHQHYRIEEELLGEEGDEGPLLKQVEVMQREGGVRSVKYICPKSLLWKMADLGEHWRDFVESTCRGRPLQVVLYADEVTPGNPLRPDKGRQFYAVFWSGLHFPNWFRSSPGWFPLAFIPHKQIASIQGGLSHLLAVLLETIFMQPHQALPKTGVPRQLTFATFLADEAAIKAATAAKGASGFKCCITCCNVLGRCEPAEVPHGFVHFTEADHSKFAPWTPAALEEAGARVAAAWATRTKAQAEAVEMKLGLNWGGGSGVLWRPAQQVAQFPVGVYWDAMHTLWATGGIGSCEVNQFCVALVAAGISLAELETFKKTFCVVRQGRGLQRLFLTASASCC